MSLDWVPDPAIQRNFDTIGASINRPVPQARVYNNANISIATGTATALTFNSERYDDGSLHSTAANTGRLTAPVAGLYSIGASVEFAANAVGVRVVIVQLNGTTNLVRQDQAASGAGNFIGVSTEYRLSAGDYVEAVVFQNSGGNLNVNSSGNVSPEFWMHRVSGYVGEQFT